MFFLASSGEIVAGFILVVVLIVLAVWVSNRGNKQTLQQQLAAIGACDLDVEVASVDESKHQATLRYQGQELLLDVSMSPHQPVNWTLSLTAEVPGGGSLWLTSQTSGLDLHDERGSDPRSSGDAAFDAAYTFGGDGALVDRIATDDALRDQILAIDRMSLRLQRGQLKLAHRFYLPNKPERTPREWAQSIGLMGSLLNAS